MRSLVTVVTPAESTALLTMDVVAAHLDLGDNVDDSKVNEIIAQVSARIAEDVGRPLTSEEVAETFRYGSTECPDRLSLSRYPVTDVDTIFIDDTELDPAEFELDSQFGHIYRLNASGNPTSWGSAQKVVVTYTGGFDPEAPDPVLQAAALALFRSLWFASGRDPLIKSEDIPGVMRIDYWVGGVGEAGKLPADVLSMLQPFKRIYV